MIEKIPDSDAMAVVESKKEEYKKVVESMRKLDKLLGGSGKYSLRRDARGNVDVELADEDEMLKENDNAEIFMFEEDVNNLSTEDQEEIIKLHESDRKNVKQVD